MPSLAWKVPAPLQQQSSGSCVRTAPDWLAHFSRAQRQLQAFLLHHTPGSAARHARQLLLDVRRGLTRRRPRSRKPVLSVTVLLRYGDRCPDILCHSCKKKARVFEEAMTSRVHGHP